MTQTRNTAASDLASIDIVAAMKHPKLYGALPQFKDLSTWGGWSVWLKAVHCLPMTLAEEAIFRKCTSRDRPPRKEPREAYTIGARRTGKSFMMAFEASHLASFRDYSKHLAAGEVGMVLIGAADRAQARVVFKYVRGIFHAIPVLRSRIAAERSDEIELTNGIVIAVATADFKSIRGRTVVAFIGDEPCFWSIDGANPDREIIAAIRPAMATIPNAKLLMISSPYAKRGLMWDIYREYYGKNSDDVLVWQSDVQTMNPTIDAALVEREIEKDPAAGRSEWLGQFRDDIESAFSLEMIESCVVPGRQELPFGHDLSHRAFVDVSGGRHDDFVVSIGHANPHLGYSTVDLVHWWTPPFDPVAVTRECADLLKRYRIQQVTGDQYGGEWPVSAFREHGITYEPSPKNKSDLYLSFIPTICGKKIKLLDNKRLIQQLQRLERRRGRSGKDSIDHPPGGRDDIANAVAGLSYVLSLDQTRDAYMWMGGQTMLSSYVSDAPHSDSRDDADAFGPDIVAPWNVGGAGKVWP